jgi:hypothetical protein
VSTFFSLSPLPVSLFLSPYPSLIPPPSFRLYPTVPPSSRLHLCQVHDRLELKLNCSWYNDIASGGADPGLNLFEKEENLPTLWTRIKNLFTIPSLPSDGEGAEDRSGAGSGWREGEGGEGGGAGAEFDLDEIDDLLETGIILFTMLGIGLLIWLRQRWGAVQAQPGFGAAFGLGR